MARRRPKRCAPARLTPSCRASFPARNSKRCWEPSISRRPESLRRVIVNTSKCVCHHFEECLATLLNVFVITFRSVLFLEYGLGGKVTCCLLARTGLSPASRRRFIRTPRNNSMFFCFLFAAYLESKLVTA